jgi:hypothetical protein
MDTLMPTARASTGMVRARASRPVRRNKTAGPSRTRKAPEPLPDAVEPLDEARFPNLAAHLRGERQEHVRRARAAGLTRKQASEHADEHVGPGAAQRRGT